jgi:hypothetical protein
VDEAQFAVLPRRRDETGVGGQDGARKGQLLTIRDGAKTPDAAVDLVREVDEAHRRGSLGNDRYRWHQTDPALQLHGHDHVAARTHGLGHDRVLLGRIAFAGGLGVEDVEGHHGGACLAQAVDKLGVDHRGNGVAQLEGAEGGFVDGDDDDLGFGFDRSPRLESQVERAPLERLDERRSTDSPADDDGHHRQAQSQKDGGPPSPQRIPTQKHSAEPLGSAQ